MLMVPENRSCERLARDDSAPGLRGRFTVHPGTAPVSGRARLRERRWVSSGEGRSALTAALQTRRQRAPHTPKSMA